ncbi:MAG TPA: cytosine permease [Candidatus Baltobacteraceae bacterium]|nr:cytosine permease [Candidatus Baltobacteraceae bacterium]
MNQPAPVYRDQVLEVEPTGIEFVRPEQRHGSPRQLFGLWFSANAEIATWMVGIFAVALYGTTLAGAAFGLIVGNLIGFALLGVLATFGPRYGVPQMVASRLAFGRYGNAFPAALSFLAGVGWFAINTVFGAYALQTITRLPYGFALALMLAAQIALAVYGYNLIHWFERVSAVLLAAGFTLLGIVTFSRADWHAPFNAHAVAAGGGEIGGIVLATALGFSYATGWVPCASDYSRYLPESTDPRRVWWYSFLGCVVPCIALEIMGAATVTAVHGVNLASSSPTQAIASLLGSGPVSTLVLLTVVLGTLTANCMNLYSGAMAALVVKFPTESWHAPLFTAAIFGALTAALFGHAGTGAPIALLFAIGVALVVLFIARYRLRRWRAALVVGILGALLASGGGHPDQTAQLYTNFLLLLSYWASPWAAVVFVDWLGRRGRTIGERAFEDGPRVSVGTYAWIAGLAASLPFWNQPWYTGPFATAFPQFGDLSYYVGFAVAAIVMAAGKRESSRVTARSTP